MKKYTMEMGEDFEVVLNNIARRKGITKAEVIRNSVATYAYLSNQKGKIVITDTEDKVIKEVVLP